MRFNCEPSVLVCSRIEDSNENNCLYVCIYTIVVTLKQGYDRNVVNKYRINLLLGVIICNIINCIYNICMMCFFSHFNYLLAFMRL